MSDLPTARGTRAPLVDASAAAAAAAHLRARLNDDDAGALDPEMHAQGIALACHAMERGDPGFYAVALSIAAELRAEPNRLRRLLRPWYEGARDMLEDHDRVPAGVDGPDAVRAALRAITSAPSAHHVAPAPPAPAPPDADAPGWEAALSRAEHAAARPAPTPSASPPPAPAHSYEAPAAARDADIDGRDAPRISRKSRGYRFSDLMWGAFFVPGVLMGLVVFFYLIALPPLNWLTGISTWDVRAYAGYAIIGVVAWLACLSLLFPPVWYAWRRGRRGWIWPIVAAPVPIAVFAFVSALITKRSPMHPEFLAETVNWVVFWGLITGGAALSIAFGSRIRGLSRRIFRRVGLWWDRMSGNETAP